MKTSPIKDGSPCDIEDWAIEAKSPSESKTCLCSALSPDNTSHNQLMCAWYAAMNSASELTKLPPPWESTPQKNSTTAFEADLPPLSPIKLFTFDETSPSAPPSIQEKASDQLLIQTDPEKIPEARIQATRQKSIARKAKMRNTHLDSLKLEKTRRGEGGIDMQIGEDVDDRIRKPPHTYPQLARLALLGSSSPLTTVEIRNWIVENFAYYRVTEEAWRGGIGACLGKGEGEGFVGVVDEGEDGVKRWRLAGGLGEGV